MKTHEKVTPELINKMREMLLSGKNIIDVRLACNVSNAIIKKHCEDIKIDRRKNKFVTILNIKNQSLVSKYDFSKLSPEDQKRYNECKPSKKHDDTYITAKKEDYSKAVIFTDFAKGDYRLCL